MYDYGYDSTLGSAVGGFVGGMIAFLVVMLIVCFVVVVLQVIGQWKIFKKAGEEGWKALIPIYNQYTLCKIVGVSPWWILIVLGCSMLSFIPIIGALLSFAASIYFTVLLNVSLARSFGKEDGFAVGLILLAPIFYFILGIKEDQYQGAKPMNDIVFKKAQEVTSKGSTSQQDFTSKDSTNVKYCSSCGSKVDVDTKFCPNCGAPMK